MSYEQAPPIPKPEQLFRDTRVEGYQGRLPEETLGLAQETVTEARVGLSTLTAGLQEAGLGSPYTPERDVVAKVQVSGNEVLENITDLEITPTLHRLEEDRYGEDGYYGNYDKEGDEQRLAEQTARSHAFKSLSEAVVAALDDDPTRVRTDAPNYVDSDAQGPGGGGDKEHSMYYGTTKDAVEMMAEVVNGGSKRSGSDHRWAETHWTGRKAETLAYQKHYLEDGSTLLLSEVPLPSLGLSIIVREMIPQYQTDKNMPRVETYVVSTVEAEKRKHHIGAKLERRESRYEKEIFDPEKAREARIKLDEDRRRELDRYEERQLRREWTSTQTSAR